MDKTRLTISATGRRRLRIGFLPLVDCAPLVVAQELGLFAAQNLEVELCREIGWATVRDKIIFGELDASQAAVGLPYAATYGLGSIACPCVTGLVVNRNGNGITLSSRLAGLGVSDVATLRRFVRESRRRKKLTFGVVHTFSSHNFLLREWLRSGGLDPDRDIRIVVVPPSQMYRNLVAGHLDGFCVGEPWNSVTVQQGGGVAVAVSTQLQPGHPDKVLMVRQQFADERSQEHECLIAALLAAAEFCDEMENRPQVARWLAQRSYLDLPVQTILPSLTGHFDFSAGSSESVEDMVVFYRGGVNRPGPSVENWVRSHLQRMGELGAQIGTGTSVLRPDIFDGALDRLISHSPASAKTSAELKAAVA
ncbi:MAG: ABC transporter substrate-binding protein [Verrucomicrobia bacterium]|nr:ABC transporter substrate-binding protein [Verrucomicrobiota bacterium]